MTEFGYPETWQDSIAMIKQLSIYLFRLIIVILPIYFIIRFIIWAVRTLKEK